MNSSDAKGGIIGVDAAGSLYWDISSCSFWEKDRADFSV